MLGTGADHWYSVETPRRNNTFQPGPSRRVRTPLGAMPWCAPAIWPAPGSPLELWRMRLDQPGVEAALWAHLRATLTPEISQQLRRIVYGTFLESQYWLLVRALRLKARRDRCQ